MSPFIPGTRALLQQAPLVVTLLIAVVVPAPLHAQGTWTPAATLNLGTGGPPMVAIDQTGAAIAASHGGWTVAHFTPATGWEAPTAPGGGSAHWSGLVANASGHAAIVWRTRGAPGTPDVISAATYSPQSRSWTPPHVLWQGVVATSILRPSAGIDHAGNVLATWVADGGRIRAARRQVHSATWLESVDTLGNCNQGFSATMSLAVSGNGDAMSTCHRYWSTVDEDGYAVEFWDIVTMRYVASLDAWQPAEFLASSGGLAQVQVHEPHVAATPSGGFMAVFNVNLNSAAVVLKSRYFDAATGAWEPPLDVPTGALALATNGAVAMSASDGWVVGYAAVSGHVRAARFDIATRQWDPPRTVDYAGALPVFPSVSVASNGRVVGAWHARVGQSLLTKAGHYNFDTGVWAISTLSTTATHANGPSVSVAPDGAAIVGWLDGPVVSPVVQVSRYTVGGSSPVLAPATVSRPHVTFAWSPPASGVVPSGYTLVASLSPGAPPVVQLPVGLQTTVTVAAPDGTFYVRIIAMVNGVAVASNEIRVDVAPAVPPSAPRNVTTTVNGSVITVSWETPASSGGAAITGYVLEAGSAPGASNLATLPLGSGTAFVSPPVPNGSYYLRVRARNSAGTGAASAERRVVVGPPPPGAPILSGAGAPGGQVMLSWTVPASGAVPTGYQLQAGTAPGASNAAVLNLPATTTSMATGGYPPARTTSGWCR